MMNNKPIPLHMHDSSCDLYEKKMVSNCDMQIQRSISFSQFWGIYTNYVRVFFLRMGWGISYNPNKVYLICMGKIAREERGGVK